MSKSTRQPKTRILRREDQRRALSSPLRLELIGLFVDRETLSVAQIAERMGRPAAAIHYHVGVLEKAGLLRRAGTRRSGRRPEALYRPVADVFRVEHPRSGPAAGSAQALKTMVAAFRMAEGEMRAALADPAVRSSGPYRNVYGARLHCRLSKKDLAELNRHLRLIEKMLSRVHEKHQPAPDDSFVSLTLALMPLRNREA